MNLFDESKLNIVDYTPVVQGIEDIIFAYNNIAECPLTSVKPGKTIGGSVFRKHVTDDGGVFQTLMQVCKQLVADHGHLLCNHPILAEYLFHSARMQYDRKSMRNPLARIDVSKEDVNPTFNNITIVIKPITARHGLITYVASVPKTAESGSGLIRDMIDKLHYCYHRVA